MTYNREKIIEKFFSELWKKKEIKWILNFNENINHFVIMYNERNKIEDFLHVDDLENKIEEN